MAELNLIKYQAEVSSDSLCGENVEEDAVFLKLENEARFVAEKQIGDVVTPAEEPDWKIIKRLALELLERTRDIQVAMRLTSALIRTDGFHGFEQAIALQKEWLEKYWDSVYPTQDPEDAYPILRLNTLGSLNDYTLVRKALNSIPLTQSALGKFSWQDIEIALGKKTASEDDEVVEVSLIEAAFTDTDLEILQSLDSSVEQSLAQTKEIINIITEKAGAMNVPDLSALTRLLQDIHQFVAEQIEQRLVLEPEASNGVENSENSNDVQGSKNIKTKQAGIHSRDEVVRAIDDMCKYFDRYEPTSPVPFLLLRAKKLLTMNFMDILRDMTPDAVEQAKNICGINDEQDSK